MRRFLTECLDAATAAGAAYADVRVVQTEQENVSVRSGRVDAIGSAASVGFGVRVIADGAWGFSSSAEMTEAEAVRVARAAVAIAKASAGVGGRRVALAPVEAYEDAWESACEVDPFAVSLEDKLAVLLAADEALRGQEAVKVSRAHMDFQRVHKHFASTLGSFIEQRTTHSGGGIVAYAVAEGEVLPRSYPNSHGGGWAQAGYEFVRGLDLVGNAPRVAEEAAALLSAEECPSGVTTLIVDGSQLGLQVHESIGHPSELDRVLGDEAAFAGTSFLSTEDLGSLRYGSEHVTVTADATVPGSLGSFAYDDEGVPAQRDHIVDRGLFAGFLSSRESAPAIGRASNGCMRADGWNRIPLVRMTTVSLEPGQWSLPDLIADTQDGLYVETNNSWSIDDKRLNFQFACEIGWLVESGRLTRMVKKPNYTGITPRFWNACDAVCSREHWRVWGLANCGKGEPMQVAHVAHGAAPARFRDVQVGVGR
ncbi:MAG: TldD/PmbA family protein [Coriobacteriia bacterium]|nr:TldD/PmbA family protein [Coriobacteriia bacterium]